MNFALNDLAATLAIGALCLVGLGFVFLIFSTKPIASVVTTLSSMSHGVMVFLAAVCFVLGMVVEDASNKFVDDDGWSSMRFLESDDDLKAEVFWWDYYRKGKYQESICYRAAKYGLLEEYGGAEGKALQDGMVSQRGPCDPNGKEPTCYYVEWDENSKAIKKVAKTFYFSAKTIAYGNPNYYDELKRIQMRIDFSRSLVAVSLSLIVLTLVIAIFKLLIVVVKLLVPGMIWVLRRLSIITKIRRPWIQVVVANCDWLPVRWWRFLAALMICGLLFMGARYANASEEKEFDKRAYGYFLINEIDSQVKPKSSSSK